MKRTHGIVYVVFGKEYEPMALHTIGMSRKKTRLPICVLTNIPEGERLPGWGKLRNVSVVHLDMPDELNRVPKILLHKYTPFDVTLYVDCDAVIMKSDVERAFDALKDADVALAPRFYWTPSAKIPELYARTFRILGVRLPVDAWYGAVFAFDRGNPAACALLERWYENWRLLNHYADLPPLVSTVKQLVSEGAVRIAKLPQDYFGLQNPDKLTIWHPQPGQPQALIRRCKVPEWEPWRPKQERWNYVTELSELSPERELNGAPCRRSGLCIAAYAFGDYADYAPVFAFSALWSQPGAAVRLFFAGAAPAPVKAALDYLARQLSSSVVVTEHYRLPVRSRPHVKDAGHQAGKCVRWLIPASEFEGFDYVYMGDIDFLLVPEPQTILEQHKAFMARSGLPHSNVRRWNQPDRVSGLQMVRTEEYFRRIDAAAAPYRTGEACLPQENNEVFLLQLLEASGIAPAGRPETREAFDALRPHHGYHLGLVRKTQEPAAYRQLWTDCAATVEPMLDSPLFKEMVRAIRTPWVAETVRRTTAFVERVLGRPVSAPAPAAERSQVVISKNRQMRERLDRIQKRKLVLVPSCRPAFRPAGAVPVPAAPPPQPASRRAVQLGPQHGGAVITRRV